MCKTHVRNANVRQIKKTFQASSISGVRGPVYVCVGGGILKEHRATVNRVV